MLVKGASHFVVARLCMLECLSLGVFNVSVRTMHVTRTRRREPPLVARIHDQGSARYSPTSVRVNGR